MTRSRGSDPRAREDAVRRERSIDSAAAIRELTDRQAIVDLVHAYCFHFDNNEPEAVAALFTTEATVDYGPEVPTIVGSAAIAATIAVGLERTFAATSHHVSNIQISFEGPDAARGITYLYAWHRYLDGSPDGELWGRYLHSFARAGVEWRIASLVLQAAGTVDFHRASTHPIGRGQPRARNRPSRPG